MIKMNGLVFVVSFLTAFVLYILAFTFGVVVLGLNIWAILFGVFVVFVIQIVNAVITLGVAILSE